MSSNPGLIDQLREDYLRCKICFQSFSRPKALPPCLHTYCEDCLRGYVYSRGYDATGTLPCPECRREVAIPSGGVAEFPDNHMVVSLQDTVTQQGLTEGGVTVVSCGGGTPQPSAPPPPTPTPTTTTNNVNLNLNYRGTINVNNTQNQNQVAPQTSAHPASRSQGSGQNAQPAPLPNLPAPGTQNPASGREPAPIPPQRPRLRPSQTFSGRTAPSPQDHPALGGNRSGGSIRVNNSTGNLHNNARNAATGRLYPVLPALGEAEVLDSRPRRPPPPPPPPARPSPVSLPPAGVPIVYNRHGAILAFGKHGDGLSDFTSPVGMVISPHGYVIVSDKRDNRILVFELRGHLHSILATNGRIQDLAINSRGHIVCANTKIANALAVAYDMNGKIVGTYGDHYTYEKPHGIAVTRRDDIIVTTLETKLVYKLSEEGQMLQKFKAKSREGQGLRKPLYVTTNENEDMIVSDEGNNCVRVFNKVGGLKFQIGGKAGHKLGALKAPRGVCTDPRGNIVVADAGNHRVQLYDAAGRFRDVIVEMKRETPGCEVRPQNVAVQGDKLVVMVTGPQYAQVRVYPYHPDNAKHQPCACQ